MNRQVNSRFFDGIDLGNEGILSAGWIPSFPGSILGTLERVGKPIAVYPTLTKELFNKASPRKNVWLCYAFDAKYCEK